MPAKPPPAPPLSRPPFSAEGLGGLLGQLGGGGLLDNLLSPQVLKKMLPLLAMLVTGYLAKKRSSGAAVPQPGGGGGLGGLLGGLLGGGGLGSMFGSGGGNPLDDILSNDGRRGST